MVKKEVISEKRWIIMGVMDSYHPWKKENQAMREKWEVGSIAYGPTKEMVEFRKSPLTKSEGQSKRSKVIKVICH